MGRVRQGCIYKKGESQRLYDDRLRNDEHTNTTRVHKKIEGKSVLRGYQVMREDIR